MLESNSQPGFVLQKLPYAEDALEPLISARTVALHYGKHHAGYVTKLNELVKDTSYAGQPLEAVIRGASKDPEAKPIFNNAAQIWNHDFYWRSMRAGGGGKPESRIQSALERDFGGEKPFREAFTKAAVGQFGSGWVWLVAGADEKLSILATSNADTPVAQGKVALLTLDVWEHAYYVDYQNRRADYIAVWLDKLANWQFAEENHRALISASSTSTAA